MVTAERKWGVVFLVASVVVSVLVVGLWWMTGAVPGRNLMLTPFGLIPVAGLVIGIGLLILGRRPESGGLTASTADLPFVHPLFFVGQILRTGGNGMGRIFFTPDPRGDAVVVKLAKGPSLSDESRWAELHVSSREQTRRGKPLPGAQVWVYVVDPSGEVDEGTDISSYKIDS